MKETGTRRQGSEKRGEKDGGQHISVKATLTHNAHFVRARNQLETCNFEMATEVMKGIWIAGGMALFIAEPAGVWTKDRAGAARCWLRCRNGSVGRAFQPGLDFR